jgi:HEAT repeat protein
MRPAGLSRWALAGMLPLLAAGLFAQDDPKQRVKYVRDLGKGGSEAIPKIEPYLADPVADVRLESVKSIVEIGTQRSLDPLIKAAADNDAEVQIHVTDGLVNFYVPGYVRTGLSGSVHRIGSTIKSKFTDTNDQVIDAYIQVRPEVVRALGRIASGGASMDARANAARGVGILRGREAVPDLEKAIQSKNGDVIFESLIALQKIKDPAAGPSIVFLLRDFNERVQVAAIETTGLLVNRAAIGDLRDVLDHAKSIKTKRAALTSLAQMPEEPLRPLFKSYLDNKDEGLRQGAAEGLGRAKNAADQQTVESAFGNEKKTGARISMAFGLVELGKRGMAEFDPLRYLVNSLNSNAYRGVARAYLIELARDPEVRRALYPVLQEPVLTKDEKISLAQVFSISGDRDSLPPLEKLSQDSDSEVAQEGLRAVKNLRARLP